jgi:acetamidase/formamidase
MLWFARERSRPASAPTRQNRAPTEFHRVLSATLRPLAHLWSGDTVHTETVDAGGTDSSGKRRAAGGNPLSGPFYIENSLPGDVLAIHLLRVRTNRSTAVSGATIAFDALDPGYVMGAKDADDSSATWTIDAAAGVARVKTPSAKLKNYTIPLRPMLGSIGVAPDNWVAPRLGAPARRDVGAATWITTVSAKERRSTCKSRSQAPTSFSATVTHARRRRAHGRRLETSMDVEFSVEVIRNKNIGLPRHEDATVPHGSGIGGSLDLAFRRATTSLARWLEQDYKLSRSEVALSWARVFSTTSVKSSTAISTSWRAFSKRLFERIVVRRSPIADRELASIKKTRYVLFRDHSTPHRIDAPRRRAVPRLADPIRVDVVTMLARRRAVRVRSDVGSRSRAVAIVVASQNAFRRRNHLRREGRAWNYYSLNPDAMRRGTRDSRWLKLIAGCRCARRLVRLDWFFLTQPSRKLDWTKLTSESRKAHSTEGVRPREVGQAAQACRGRQHAAECCGSSGLLRRDDREPGIRSRRTSTTTDKKPAFRPRRCCVLGCGNPTALAQLHEGETVLDLGSGGGIDVSSLGKARRADGEGLWPRHDRRHARTGEREQASRRRDQRRIPQGRDREHPASG